MRRKGWLRKKEVTKDIHAIFMHFENNAIEDCLKDSEELEKDSHRRADVRFS